MNNCTCPKGFYEDGVSKICPACHLICDSCVAIPTSCTACKGNRVASVFKALPEPSIVNCSCPIGFYENFKSSNCPQCKHQCLSCVNNA